MRPIDADKLEAKCKEIIAQEREYGTATVSWAHAYESFLDMLETTPTIEPQRWIPVTERLPDFYMNEDGCICTKGKVVFRVVSTHTVHLGYAIKRLCVTDHDSFEIVVWYDNTGDRIEDVTHWMPLPSPAKGE